MEKLRVKFSNGDIFEVPARIIAENRADYYADLDGYDSGSNEWEAEVQNGLDNDFEIEDWVQNNMNWEDLEPYAEKINGDDFDYSEEFSDAEFEIK